MFLVQGRIEFFGRNSFSGRVDSREKVEKVITTLKDRIGHSLMRHLTEIST